MVISKQGAGSENAPASKGFTGAQETTEVEGPASPR